MPDTACQEEQLSPAKERQILEGAALIFARDGYEGASMSRIAGEAGVSKGTLYNYFSGKAELFTAYVQRECAGRIALMFDDLDPDAPFEESLRLIGRRMVETMLSEPGLVTYRVVIAEAPKFPELAIAFYEAGPARATLRLAAWIERSVQAGHLRVPDPEFAAEQLFALMQTKLCMKRRLCLIEHPSPQEIDHVVECAVHLFLHGYAS
jgi:AcrR family transcriptional regulator